MSVISALAGRRGSNSPNTRAVIFSYAPTLPKVIPPNVGDSRRTTLNDVTPPSAADGIRIAPVRRASTARPAVPATCTASLLIALAFDDSDSVSLGGRDG